MNIPNFLSLLRLLMVPLFPIVYNSGLDNANYYAVGIYILAACTDVVDGWFARNSGQITKLGRILDPLADKAMAFCVLLTITIAGAVHWWAVVVIFLKELTMGLGALFLLKKEQDVFSAVKLGKSATVIFFLVCVTLALFSDRLTPLAVNCLLAAAVGMNIASLAYYLYKYVKHVAKRKHTNKN